MEQKSYFSVNWNLIQNQGELSYDLYVNSSGLKNKQKFVRIFPKGQDVTAEDIADFKRKYNQLYVEESQRSDFLRAISKSSDAQDVEAMTVIKDSAIQYLNNIFDSEKEFSTELLGETIDGCREAVESMIDVLDDHNIDSLRALIGDLSGHDFYTYDHSINVSMYCISILKAINPNATRSELMHIGLGGLLHDLGKIKIPTQILNSPEGLTDDEYKKIKQHPTLGIDLLKSKELDTASDIHLETIARIVHEHHENWDGKGYPQGLREKEIHVFARICTIADFFDAITTKRSYAEVLPISQALDVMEKTVEKKLDPKLFKYFKKFVTHEDGYVKSLKEIKIADDFDPSIPHAHLPLEELKDLFEQDFGKIKFMDDDVKKKK